MAWVLNDPPLKIGAELAECQRYQIVFSIPEIIGVAHAYDTGHAYFTIFLPVTLRGNPASLDIAKIMLMTNPYIANGVHPTGVYNLLKIPSGISGSFAAPGLSPGQIYLIACHPVTEGSPFIIDNNL